MQVWKDALAQKQESPYMRHTLASGTIRNFHFCPYEVNVPFSSIFDAYTHAQVPASIPASSMTAFQFPQGQCKPQPAFL